MSSNSSKKRKPKFTIEPVKVSEQDAASTRGVLGRMMGRIPMEREGVSPESLPNSDSLPEFGLPDIGSPKIGSLPIATPQAYQFGSLPNSGSLPESSSLKSTEDTALDLMASLPDVDGYMKFWHQITDHLYRQLTMAEQAVHMQLFRLSWGHNKPTCVIGLPGLAKRTGASKGTVQTAIGGLVKKGLVQKVRTVFGKDREQGVEYLVVPPPSMSKSGRLSNSGSLPKSSTIKEVRNKEINKGESAPPDYKNCPDCQGSGFWYPEGTEKGVAKCAHQKLRGR